LLSYLKSRRAVRIYITIGILIALFFVFNNLVMPWYVTGAGQVKVISVVGMRFDDARKVLDSLGMDVRQGDIRTDSKYPIGTVINQNPIPGRTVNKGRRIYLTLSGGEKLVTVPGLRGRTLRDARFQLEREGLRMGAEEYAVSDTFPENTIISQSVLPDIKIKRDAYVSVVVSLGKTSERVTVPELSGKTLQAATDILAALGLKIGNVSYQPLANFLPNTIIDQFPHIGEQVPRGQAVDVVVVRVGEKAKEGYEN
jgi:serine/threonine-protein kinase